MTPPYTTRTQVTEFFLMTMFFFLLIGCTNTSPPLSTRGQALTPPTTLGDALQGDHDVCWGHGPCSHIGVIEVRGGQYRFTALEGANLEEARKRLSFVARQEGSYTMSYSAPYHPGFALDDVAKKDDTLLRLTFDGPDLEGMREFEVRSDASNRNFFLHGTIGEFQSWGVIRSWPRP